MAETLPEGTDHVIPGAGIDAGERMTGNSPGDGAGVRAKNAEADRTGREPAGALDFRERIAGQAGQYRDQATDKAREYAVQGKDKASGALDEVARLITDNAAQIDDKIGSQYGDYARRAAGAVQGAAEQLRGKDVDELVEDARAVIRKSPALALGAAAAAGFLLARVLKSSSETLAEGIKAGATGSPAGDDAPASSTGSGKTKKAAKPSTGS